MANNQGRINFGISFNVDKTGLNQLKNELQSLQNLSEKDLINIGSKDAIADLEKIKTTAKQVEDVLEKSFNPKLNSTDLTKFRQELNKAGLNISTIKTNFDKAGVSGQNAFRNITTELLTTNKNLKESSKWLDKMADTMSNTVRWSIASTAVNSMTGAIQKAWSFTKQLDTSLNDIRIVTGKSADEMDKFAIKATKAAQALGATTKSYADAALIYYQQGLQEQDVQARANVTTKVANVTGQDAKTVSENLTAVWNGYKVSAQEAELYVDKLSAVAATTAADLEELSISMSKVASAANIMGVDIDQLNAQLSTIVSVTREAPESIGTALKTVYARMSDIEAGLDTETTLGEYTSQMKAMGINVLDAAGNLRDMGDVVEEIGNNWNNLSRNQQTALAQTIAGTRQYSRMMALFDNWDMYQAAKTTSAGSAGALQRQQDIYLDSMEAHLNKLTAEAEELYSTLMDPKGLNPLIDALTSLVGLVENFVEGLGGGAGLLRNLGAIGVNVFGNQITRGISRGVRNLTGFKENIQREQSEKTIMEEYDIMAKDGKLDDRQKTIIQAARDRYKVLDKLSDEEKEATKELIKQTNEYYKQTDELEKQKKDIDDIAKRYANLENTDDAKATSKAIETSVGAIKSEVLTKSTLDALHDIETSRTAVSGKEVRVTKARNATYTARDEGDEKRFDEKYEEWINQEKELIKKQEEAKKVAEDRQSAISDMVTAINNSTIAEMANEKQKEKLKTIKEKINRAYDEEGNIIADNEEQIQEANKAAQEYNDLLEEMAREGIEAGKKIKDVNKGLDDTAKKVEECEAALKKAKESFDLTEAIGSVVSLAGGLMNIGSAIENIQNLGSIWNNEDLSTGEKMLQTIINITTSLGMLASGISSIREAWKDLKAAKQVISNIITTKTERDQAKAAREAALAYDAKSAAQNRNQKENTEQAISNKVTEATEPNGGTGNLSKGQKWVGKLKTFGKKIVKSPKVPTIGGAIGGAAAAAGVAIGIWDLIANQDKKAMESAEEQAGFLQETLSSVTAQYNQLNSAISNLSSATNTLEGLTEGTVEWKQALFEVNSQVLDLLKEYPELNSYISRDKNGRLEIDQKGLELIQENQLKEMQMSQAASLLVQSRADKERIDYLEEEWADAANNSDAAKTATIGSAAVAGGATGAVVGAKVGTAVGTIWPGIGNLVGAAVGTAAGALVGLATGAIGAAVTEAAEVDNVSENEDFKKALEQYKISGDAIFDSNEALAKALGKDVNELSKVEKALVANKEATTALCDAMLAEEAQAYNRQVAIGAGILGEDASEGAKAYVGKYVEDNEVWTYDKVKDEYGGYNEADERALRKLLDLSGIGTYVGVEGANKVQYRDKATGEVKEQDIDWVYKQLQYYLALEEARNLGDTAEAEVKKITDLFTNDEVKNSIQSLINAQVPDLKKLSKKEFESLVNESSKAMETLSDQQDAALQKGISNYQAAWNQVITSLPEEIQSSFTAIINGLDLNIAELTAASELYNTLFESLGKDGIDQFKLIKDALGDNFGEFAEEIKNTTLDSGNIEEQLRDILDSLNVDNIDAKVLRDFANALELVTNAGKGSLEAMQKHYREVTQVALNLRQFDTVDAEFYDKLSAGQREYFQLMADGSYQLIGDAREFYKLVRGETSSTLSSNINDKINILSSKNTRYTELTEENGLINQTKILEDRINNEAIPILQQQYFNDIIKPLEEDILSRKGTTKVVNKNAKHTSQYYTDMDTASIFANVRSWNEVEKAISSTDYNGYNIESTLTDLAHGENKVIIDKIIEWNNAKDNRDNWVDSKVQELDWKPQVSSSDLEEEARQLYEDIKNIDSELLILFDQLLAQQSTLNEVQTVLTQYSQQAGYIKEDSIKNNLLRIAAEQFDLNNSEQSYLIKEAIDEFIGEDDLLNIEEYKDLLAQIALGFKDIDIKQKAAKNSLAKFVNEFDTLSDKDKIDNLNDQMVAQIANLDLAQQKLNAYKFGGARNFELQATLKNIGVENPEDLFDEYGQIDAAQFAALQEKYAEKQFASEADAKTVKEALAAVEKYQDDFSAIENEIDQGTKHFQELALQKFDVTLNLDLDANKAKKEFEQFKRDIIIEESDFSTLGQSYINDVISGYNSIATLQAGFDELENLKQAKEINDAQYEARRKQLTSDYYAEMSEIKTSLENYEEARLSAIEDISNAYEKQLSYLDDINSALSHQKTVTELIYGDDAKKHLASYYKASIDNAKLIEAINKDSYNYWKAQYDAALRNSSISEEEIDKLYEHMNSNAQSWAESITETLQLAQENYLNNVSVMLEDFDKKISNGRSITSIGEEWQWTKEQADNYLTSLDAFYGMQNVKENFTKAINESTNIKAQQKINDLMKEELNTLENMDKLSQYDLDRANKKLEILQAQIALEEARDAKTEMRLMRGADGTYGYQYVANEGEVYKAEEELRKVSQEIYNLDYEAYQKGLDDFYQIYEEWLSKMEQAWADGQLTGDEASMLQNYENRLTELAEESSRHQANLKATVEESAQTFGLKASEVSSSIETLFNTGLAKTVTSFVENTDKVKTSFKDLKDDISAKASEFTTIASSQASSLQTLFYGDGKENKGIIGNYETLAQAQKDNIKNAKDEKTEIDKLASTFKTLAEKLQPCADYLVDINTELAKLPTSYDSDNTSFDNAADSVNGLAEAWEKYGKARITAALAEGYSLGSDGNIDWTAGKTPITIGEIDESIVPPKSESTSITEDDKPVEDIPGFIGDTAGNQLKALTGPNSTWSWPGAVAVNLLGNEADRSVFTSSGDTWVLSDTAKMDLEGGKENGQLYEDKDGVRYIRAVLRDRNDTEVYVRQNSVHTYKKDLKVFDTGGYTGEWHSSEGRLAMLHEKELVLKKEDTANFLDALEILRSLNISMLQNVSNLGNIKASTNTQSLNNAKIEQTIQINAEFPDATDTEEIKAAFNDLINLATQKAFEESNM